METRKRKRRNREEQTHCPRAEGIAVLIWQAILPAWPGLAIVWRVSFGAGVLKKRWLGDAHARKELDVRQFVMRESSLVLPGDCGGSGLFGGAGESDWG